MDASKSWLQERREHMATQDGSSRSAVRVAAALFARPLVRAWSGGLFVLMASGVVFPLVFLKGTHLNRGTAHYFVGGLIATAVVFLGSAITARLRTPDLAFKVEKLAINEFAEGAVLQVTLEGQNNEDSSVVMHDWRACLDIGEQTRRLRRAVGQPRLPGTLDLPFLDRIGPLPPGPTDAQLHFVVDGMRQSEVDKALSSGTPVVLSVEVRSGKHSWRTSTDLTTLPIEKQPVVRSGTVGAPGAWPPA